MSRLLISSLLAGLATALLSPLLAAQSLFLNGRDAQLMRSPLKSTEQLKILRVRGVEYDLNEARDEILLRVDSESDRQILQAAGFDLRLDADATARFNQPLIRSVNQPNGIVGFECYRTVTETYTRATELVALKPEIVEWLDIGDSYLKTVNQGGDDIRVLHITNRSIAGPKPAVFILSAIHAREYVTAETNTRLAEFLVTQYGINPDVTWLVDHHDINLALVGNPDGRRLAETSATRTKRKNINTSFTCSTNSVLTGVDLNRNYPFDWNGPAGGSTSVCTETYRGLTRGSEPEAQSLIARAQAVFPDQRSETVIPAVDLTTTVSLDASGVYIDVHSNGAGNWYPWGNNAADAPNGAQLRTLARKMGFYNNLPTDKSSASGAIAGATDDFHFATLGVAAFTLEMAGSGFFPTCSSYESSLANPTIQSLFFAAKVARAPYRLPSGPEIHGQTAVASGSTVLITANVSDIRSNGAQDYQVFQAPEVFNTIVGVDLYSTPPWIAGATPVASFSATDGSFNSTAEAITLSIPQTQLPSTRSLWYLQARDAGPNGFEKGPVAAVFVQNDVQLSNGFE